MRLVIRFLKDENAATAIEYGLIAAGVALAIITVIKGVGKAQHYVLLNLIAVELGDLLPHKYRHWSARGHQRHFERARATCCGERRKGQTATSRDLRVTAALPLKGGVGRGVPAAASGG